MCSSDLGDHQNARRIESGAERLYARMDLAGLHPREQARPVKDLASGDSAPFPASIAGQVIAGKACGIRQHALERISYSAIFEAISLSIHIVSFGYIFFAPEWRRNRYAGTDIIISVFTDTDHRRMRSGCEIFDLHHRMPTSVAM